MKIEKDIENRLLQSEHQKKLNEETRRLEELLANAREEQDLDAEAEALYLLSEQYFVMEDFAKSAEYAQNAIHLYEILGDINRIAQLHGKIGNVKSKLGFFQEAIQEMSLALKYFESIGNEIAVASMFNNIGLTYNTVGEYEQAREYLLKSLAIKERIGDPKLLVSTFNNLANSVLRLGNKGEAIEYYLRGLYVAEQLESKELMVKSLGSLGNAYTGIDDFTTALEYTQRYLELAEELGFRSDISKALTFLGNIYQNLQYSEEALEMYTKALSIVEEIGVKRSIAELQTCIAICLNHLGDQSSAIDYAQSALILNQEIGDKEQMSFNYHTLGEICKSKGDDDKAIKYFQEQFNLGDRMGNPDETCKSLLDIAQIELKRIKESSVENPSIEKIQILCEKALEFAEQSKGAHKYALANQILSESCELIGDYQKANLYLRKYVEYNANVISEKAANKAANLRVTLQVEQAQKVAEAYRQKNEELQQANDEILRQQQLLEEQSRDIELTNTHLQETVTELQDLNNEKNEFLGIAAHDLKNPLASIVISAGAIRRYLKLMTPEEIDNQVKSIEITAGRMKEIVSNLLDVNAIETGQMQLTMSLGNLAELTKNVVHDYQPRAFTKGILLQFSCSDEQIFAPFDKTKLYEILENMISNALKFSNSGTEVLVNLAKHHDYVEISVHDKGPGISEQDMKKLFGKFSRLSAQPTGGEHSTGLGLSIVKKLVEAMNGHVWCESELGIGSVFYLTLPQTIV